MPEVREANGYDIEIVAHYMRQSDRHELIAASGQDPFAALSESFDASEATWALSDDHGPFAIFGVASAHVPCSQGLGVPWLLATDRLDDHAQWFLRSVTKRHINLMFNHFGDLVNYVHHANRKSIAWLRWAGFTVHPPEVWGLGNERFHLFEANAATWRAKNHV